MAKPIEETPVFEGEDAIAVLNIVQEAPTQEDKEFAKEIRNQRIVLFSRWYSFSKYCIFLKYITKNDYFNN